MHPNRSVLVRLTSGPPWYLSCTVESIGPDCLCRIDGGDRHVGAVALSQWRPEGAVVELLTVRGHKEQAIAADAARVLCTAGRRSVVCIAGIHFDGIARAQIEEIVRSVHELTRLAAREIESRRLHGSAVDLPEG